MSTSHHQVVVIGGGSAGITVAARLKRGGVADVAVIEPSDSHYYQPLWTLVGGGRATVDKSVHLEASVMPKGVQWVKDRAEGIDPENKTVTTGQGDTVGYDKLVVCPGIQLDWNKIPGSADAMQTSSVSSNYLASTAPKTWQLIQQMRSGTALFTMPSGPIKCAGAPQKIAYLAADYWREQGVLNDIRVVLVLPTPGMFGVKVFADQLEKVVARYGIEVHKSSELVEVDPEARTGVVADNANGTKESIAYDMMHFTPPQSAPDWVKASPVADASSPAGYVEIDKNSMQHIRFPDVFALGDAGSSPNSKTGAAIRKQAPVVATNVIDALHGRPLSASYGGYASCPLTTSRHHLLLAEFDYTMEPKPTFRFPDTTKEVRDNNWFKRYGLPAMYWNAMLKGRA